MNDLLSRFVDALDAEIAVIEKDSRDRGYELLSGRLEEKATGSLYVFVLADALRVPEDAAGTLRVGDLHVRAMVVAQEGNRIWLLLESQQELPSYMPSARLALNETDLLRRLKEKIQLLQTSGDVRLAPHTFGLEESRVASEGIPESIAPALELKPDKLPAIEQCLGSEITFLWGPPGTGKTFVISALVAILTSQGQTVLVTSHTHAAVEQALWALIKPPEGDRKAGPLYETELATGGRILKVGPLQSTRIPRNNHLNSFLEDRAREREGNIEALLEEQARITQVKVELEQELRPWQELERAETNYIRAAEENQKAETARAGLKDVVEGAERTVSECEATLAKASSSLFIGRGRRVAQAQSAWNEARQNLRWLKASAAESEAIAIVRRSAAQDSSSALLTARAATGHLPKPADLHSQLQALQETISDLSGHIEAIRDLEREEAATLLKDAAALFLTLTKLYMDPTVDSLAWDTVIIDEASMAMPPLVAYAASHAKRRVIVVGDMFQLPPIVHGSEQDNLLGQDIFRIRGITDAVKEGKGVPQLAKLTTQRRMRPEIAQVARTLIPPYRDLLDDVAPDESAGNPLVFIDIAGLNAWCCKLPGSLSRFNFVSGQAAVEVAALFASRQAPPAEDAAPNIGIVTPYSAQRRYLGRTVQALQLERWVTAGTVHTFQGNECDVIIFDSVLGEPHWTARFTNPNNVDEVCKDLNVAVTRARKHFIFVGDSRWLDRRAGANSAYGKLWSCIKNGAVTLDAVDLLGEGFRERVAQSTVTAEGWQTSSLPESASLLTEKDFYPALAADLAQAEQRVVLYTPYIGKTRWPQVEPLIASLRGRGVNVFVLHKPLSDKAWKEGDPEFGRAVFHALQALGVKLIPVSGVHAKTIVIDSHIVYEGSLNWASQTSSYEHMWRFKSKDMALLVERRYSYSR